MTGVDAVWSVWEAAEEWLSGTAGAAEGVEPWVGRGHWELFQ